ncbi:MAG: hypothetical protein ACRYGA_02120 [Janthinobacterium lividum]
MNAVTETVILELDQPRTAATPQEHAMALSENSPMSMMLAAQRQGASLADVREMMAIHREMKADDARDVFRSDFAAFRGENVIILKTKTVDRGRGGSFVQAEYDEVCRRLSPALSRHGFSFRHDQKFGLRRLMTESVESDVGWVWVTCYLEHRKGHSEKLELEGPPGDLSVNTPTQNMQSTASYLKRQSLLAITGTATGGEDDEALMRKKDTKEDDKPSKFVQEWIDYVLSFADDRDKKNAALREARKALSAAKDIQDLRTFNAKVSAA